MMFLRNSHLKLPLVWYSTNSSIATFGVGIEGRYNSGGRDTLTPMFPLKYHWRGTLLVVVNIDCKRIMQTQPKLGFHDCVMILHYRHWKLSCCSPQSPPPIFVVLNLKGGMAMAVGIPLCLCSL